MIDKVYPRDEPMSAFTRNGEVMTSYGYIIIPYCQNGTLLDFLIKRSMTGGLFSEAA
jgi:hypothetical protein